LLIQTDRSPGTGYRVGMLIVALCAISLVAFLFLSGSVSILKASLLMLGVGTLVFFYAIPVLAKRRDYIGQEPKMQFAKLKLLPYMMFVAICLGVAVYGAVSAA
jgi:hypothetical protein